MARNKPLPRALRYIGNEFNRGELLRRDKDDLKTLMLRLCTTSMRLLNQKLVNKVKK